MDESTFDIDRATVTAGARRFPAHDRAVRRTDAPGDLSYIARRSAHFARHCFDENGHS